MMTEGEISRGRAIDDYTAIVLSWSLEDIFNEDLFKDKVEKIPDSFQSVEQYMGSYAFPLLEETRAQMQSSMEIISTAPFAEVIRFQPCGMLSYEVNVELWRNRFSDRGKEPYKTLPGDIVVLANAKPETVSDLQRIGFMWIFASVTKIPYLEDRENIIEDENEEDSSINYFKVNALKDISPDDGMQKSLFVIFLINITTKKRIWNALHKFGNLKIIKKVLSPDSMVERNCSLCPIQSSDIWGDKLVKSLSSKLNESQTKAVLACLHRLQCYHKSSVELIWGPPGTGKTETVSMLLFTLLRMKCRTVICAPTNVAIKEVAIRVLKLLKESNGIERGTDALCCYLGDLLLFGNEERLKVNSEIEEIYLDYRVQRLAKCFFGSKTGWWHCFTSMIDFLKDCVSQYSIFLEEELIKEQKDTSENKVKEKGSSCGINCSKLPQKSFLEFAREKFKNTALPLRRCVFDIYTHMPKSYILESNLRNIFSLVNLLDSFESLLFHDDLISEELEKLFSHPKAVEDSNQTISSSSLLLFSRRSECLSVLKTLHDAFMELVYPFFPRNDSIEKFCFQTASLIFCSASSSYKLYRMATEPFNLLVIDEAAQLRECESTIPLQLPGIRHAILLGDECQLPAMVKSKVSSEAGFGKSLFERLSLLGHSKHLLNIQYRMHPSISYFPNSSFYFNQILDAPKVRSKSYEKQYLPGPMFGPYSFINLSSGREEIDDVGHSRRNMVEVAVVLKLVRNLYKVCGSEKKLCVGVISPYTAQVVAIQEKLGRKYDQLDGFSVRVKSIDGFQGGEEDIIIISTVRSNNGGAIGFVANPQRTNVALTRARHALWILGNGKTLANSESVWESLVHDAKQRQCFFDADEDKELAKVILEVKKEYVELDDLLSGDSVPFKSARWKVLFSDNFRKSFGKLTSVRTKTSILNLLLRLSSGWRPKNRNVDVICEKSSMVLKQFKVEDLYIVCSIDLVKELRYTQVLKAWDVMPLEDIEKLVKRLDSIFDTYTDDFIGRCRQKCQEGDLEVPKTWTTSFDIIRHKNLTNNENGTISSAAAASDGRSYVENSKVSDSLLLMKFYSLSCGVVSHLLSDRDGRELDLPFEVTDQELEIILFQRSTFILGRSGTGKTTVLTMKLFKKEQLYHMATEGFDEVNGNTSVYRRNSVVDAGLEIKETVLRQLFVTVSPKLCYAVKHHVSQLKRFASSGKYYAESTSLDAYDIDDTAQFKGIPDSFVDIPAKSYPLVITLNKFLMMLDGTLGNSYFDRFSEARELLHGKTGSSGTTALHTFIKTREVDYEKFCSNYWPHFNSQLTKKFGSSRIFTEIMSHVKGGLQAGKSIDGRLNREDYVVLSAGRMSTLSMQERERIYDIFQNYEKMKMENGEFDVADLVIDLHRRLKNEKYDGDMMDFVYIDEVQDLTMRQIALFQYICKNVIEGFVFSGDTAQTIARGIDFRFEDIRSLFYNEFVLGSKSEGNDGKRMKGQISKIFHLSQNFRTHDGVLRLAQSVIDLLYRFFPLFIDALSHETSLIYGESPILLESGKDENAIATIFGNSRNVGGNLVGFGAEQVILVRDDPAKNEILKYVGKQALVLTIVECKGLEFQDVLLYNFFSSSPLRNQWRVIYEYMKEQGLLDVTSPRSFPSFIQAKHNVLCSELKQLYVAITRTRQRLWICENIEEISKPVFDYWKKKCLVQVRELDDSLAQAMQVASSPEEWKSRGYKLLREGNYEMATMCFERAGDRYGEKLARAAGLKAAADRMHVSNPEMASVARREAAEIFYSIGKAENAAECFYILEEYERAGKIYLEKCGESALERAGDCFLLARCYKFAVEVYARGNYFSKCLSCCAKGELFDMGLQYIKYWKQQDVDADDELVKRRKEMEKIEQEFLKSCALHYHKLNDKRAMMEYVRAFNSMASIRTFLKSLGCLDELLSFEVESGNFLEAANIAKLRGELLLEADLLGKGGYFKDASKLTLWVVFANSLWSAGSRGWPLKQFREKEELLTIAKSFAKKESIQFYELVCAEADILSDERSSLFMMKQQLNVSQRHESIRGEVLSARNILDCHLHLNTSKYLWEDELIFDMERYTEDILSDDQVSVETLVYFWNFWKDKVVQIFEYLERIEIQDINEYRSSRDFCLNYLGVWRQFNNLDAIFILHNPDAEWVRELDSIFLRRNGKLVSIDVRHFVSAAQNYWSSELFSVGIKVLENLKALYNFSVNNSFSFFCQSKSLTHIYEVAKFLLKSKFLNLRFHTETLQDFVKISTKNIFGCIFPLNWLEALRENMIHIRGTEILRNLLEEVIFEIISSKNKVSYKEIGCLSLLILGSGKGKNELHVKIAERLKWNEPWKDFFENLGGRSIISKFHEALLDIYNANWRRDDYISPCCFLYLVERYLFLLSYFKGYIITKSSFVEWLIYQEENTEATSSLVADDQQSLEDILGFIEHIVGQFLYNKGDTMHWIKISHTNVECFSVLVSRLVVLICLLYLNFGKCLDLLSGILGKRYITEQLPREFCVALRRGVQCSYPNVNMFAEAFKKMGNPLVIVRSGENCSNYICPDAIFVDMKVHQSKEECLRLLFPASQRQTGPVEVKVSNLGKGLLLGSSAHNKNEGNLLMNHDHLLEIFEALMSVGNAKDKRSFMINASIVKVELDRCIQQLIVSMSGCPQKNPSEFKDESLIGDFTIMVDEMKELSSAMDVSELQLLNNIPTIRDLCKRLQSRKPKLEPFLNQLCLQQVKNPFGEQSSGQCNAGDNNRKPDESIKDMMKVSSQATVTSGTQGNSQATENVGKGNNKSKKHRGKKGGRKHK